MKNKNKSVNLDKALAMFEPDFKLKREKQGIQEHREPIKAFTKSEPSLDTDMSDKASTKR